MSTPNNIPMPPFQEPLRATLIRTTSIAVAIGLVFSLRMGRLDRWPMATLLALWPSLGGHFVELFFLNALRPQLPQSRPVQTAVRLLIWFVGGVLLMFAMRLTALAVFDSSAVHSPAWWAAGLGFIAIELIVHVVLQLRIGRSFYNGQM